VSASVIPFLSKITQRWTILVFVGAISAGCGKRLSPSECESLLDHYTARLVLSETPEASPFLIAEKQKQARELAQREPRFEFDQCNERVSRRQFECAMTAGDVDSIERCLTL
jgi:hypothetical protein